MKHYVYRNSRPKLVIECTGSKELGRCYSATYYRITSLEKLSKEKLKSMFDIGLIGLGQTFSILSKCDGTEKPAGTDFVPCAVVDSVTGEVLNELAINPYTGEPYAPNMQHYYVYNTESRCDSGD